MKWKQTKEDKEIGKLVEQFPWLKKLVWFAPRASHERLHFVEGSDEIWDRIGNSGFWSGRNKKFTAACGLRTLFALPGIFSRMGLPRCAHCCRSLGIPSGKGSGVNDKRLVALARRRTKANA